MAPGADEQIASVRAAVGSALDLPDPSTATGTGAAETVAPNQAGQPTCALCPYLWAGVNVITGITHSARIVGTRPDHGDIARYRHA